MIYGDRNNACWWVRSPADFYIWRLPAHEAASARAEMLMHGQLRIADERQWAKLLVLDGSWWVSTAPSVLYDTDQHAIEGAGVIAYLGSLRPEWGGANDSVENRTK